MLADFLWRGKDHESFDTKLPFLRHVFDGGLRKLTLLATRQQEDQMAKKVDGYNVFRVTQLSLAHEDARLKKDVCAALCYAIPSDAGRIEIKVVDGQVEIHGVVRNRSTKATVKACVESIDGVLNVQNGLKVGSRQDWPVEEPVWI